MQNGTNIPSWLEALPEAQDVFEQVATIKRAKPQKPATSLLFRPPLPPPRSTDPAKQAADLARLRKPVVFRDSDDEVRRDLPLDVKRLDQKLHSVEYLRHESAENTAVHAPLLTLVLSHGCPACVSEEYLSAAVIMPSCMPRLDPECYNTLLSGTGAGVRVDAADCDNMSLSSRSGYGYSGVDFCGGGGDGGSDSAETKKVDFVLLLETVPGSGLARCISDAAEALAWETGTAPTVNQTAYAAVRLRPLAVAVATKRRASQTDEMVQLGMWTAAWHQRMGAFLSLMRRACQQGEDSSSQPTAPYHLVTLPLISVVDHAWHIYYACNRGDKIEVIGPEELGSTQNLTKIYILLANLRHIAAWVDDEFRKFLERFFVEKDWDQITLR